MSRLRSFLESLGKRRRGFFRLAVVLVVNAVVLVAVTQRLANKQDRLARELERVQVELSDKTAELEELSATETRVSGNSDAVEAFWTEVVEPRVPGLTQAWE